MFQLGENHIGCFFGKVFTANNAAREECSNEKLGSYHHLRIMCLQME